MEPLSKRRTKRTRRPFGRLRQLATVAELNLRLGATDGGRSAAITAEILVRNVAWRRDLIASQAALPL